MGGGGTIRLVVGKQGAAAGWAAARELRTMTMGAPAATEPPTAGGGVACHTDGSGQHIIDLRLPTAPGRTAQGSCVAV